MPIHCRLRVKDPMRLLGCVLSDPLCMVKADQQCDKIGVIYQIQCSKCLEDLPPDQAVRYVGMTRTSVYNKMLRHLKSQKAKEGGYPHYRHDVESHNGVPQRYVM